MESDENRIPGEVRMLVSVNAFLVLFLAASSAARVEQLLSKWQKHRETTSTLAVDFTLERCDQVFGRTECYDGALKLQRTQPTRGYLELRSTTSRERVAKYWLIDDQLYWLVPEAKVIFTMPLPEAETFEFLVRRLHPLILCLDKKQALSAYRFSVTKQDDWYAYIDVTPRRREGDRFHSAPFAYGRIVVQNKAFEHFPRDTLRELYYLDHAKCSWNYRILKWQHNGPNAIGEQELRKPDLPIGWELQTWP